MADPNPLSTFVGKVTYSAGGKITDLRSTTRHGIDDSTTGLDMTYLV
jgi:hypothetical protein